MINKKYPSDKKFKDITKGYIISKEEYKKLLLKPDLDDIHDESPQFLVIYAVYPRLTRITCYPIHVNTLWKIKMTLTNSNHEVFTEISQFIKSGQTIHTTGLSEKNGVYVVENYITLENDWDAAKRLVDNLSQIKDIVNCQIEEILSDLIQR